MEQIIRNFILGWCRQTITYQCDIVALFEVDRSTVENVCNQMEKEGLIKVSDDTFQLNRITVL